MSRLIGLDSANLQGNKYHMRVFLHLGGPSYLSYHGYETSWRWANNVTKQITGIDSKILSNYINKFNPSI